MRFLFVLAFVFLGATLHAEDKSPKGQAQWLLERLTGVKWPATSPVVSQMTAKVQSGDSAGAAQIAMQQPQFLNVKVKQMALKLSTREETLRLTFNDFAAMFIGVTRDGTDARELLYGNYSYVANPNLVTVPSDPAKDILSSNNHYEALDAQNANFGAVLRRVDGQTLLSGENVISNPDPAGLLTSRTWLFAHAIAGTNRRLIEYTFREFMCIPLINWADTNAPDIRVGRDIDRFPGGDNMKYETSCKGCHTVQDGFRGAFAKWDWNTGGGFASYGNVGAKYNQNASVYPQGYVTVDDSWVNHATRGVNSTLFGWRGLAPNGSGVNTAGSGVNSFGRLVANSQRFSQCMAQHVFENVCQRQLTDSDAKLLYLSLGLAFEANQYNMKKLFEIVATHPKCRM